MSGRSWRRIVDDLAIEFGATVHTTGGGHLKLSIPGCGAVYCAGSPTSDRRETKNLRATLRRAVRLARVPAR